MSDYTVIPGLLYNTDPTYYLPIAPNLLPSETAPFTGTGTFPINGATVAGNVVTFANTRSGVMMTGLNLVAGTTYVLTFSYTGNIPFCVNVWDGGSKDNYSPNYTATKTLQTSSFVFIAPTSQGSGSGPAFLNNNPTTAGTVNFTFVKLEVGSVPTS